MNPNLKLRKNSILELLPESERTIDSHNGKPMVAEGINGEISYSKQIQGM
jgi:hypothetical protein